MRQLAIALILLCWVWIALSYLGGLHPAADSLSVLRFEASLLALALSVVLSVVLLAMRARCPRDPWLNVIAMQVETGVGPLWVVALHLRWPWPYGQAAQVDRILPFLAALDGPVVVAGDFNMVPWGHSVQQISAAAGAERIGRLERTFDFGTPLVRLRIDHVLAPRGWHGNTALRPLAGSDHFGVVARFGPP